MKNNKTNFLYIQRPQIVGNIVHFSWDIDFDPNKSTNEIYVDYYDIDISAVPMQVHYNTIIGLLLNHLIGLHIPTVVITEDMVSEDIATFWVNYHGLQNVHFANVGYVNFEKSAKFSEKGSVGILYGGGKDSYFALDILSKNSRIKKINLISFVIPDAHVNAKTLEERRDNFLNSISKEYAVNIIKIRTNARGIIRGYHLDLYFAPLGVLVYLNLFDYMTFSYEFCHYFIPNQQNDFGFRRSQISYIKKLSEFYSDCISSKQLTIFNANQHMTELSSFGYLSTVNPNFYEKLLMCESINDVDIKWCCSCTKCGEFILFSMYYNVKQSDIDLDWFFSKSPWILSVVAKIKQMEQKGIFIEGTTHTLHFDSFKFVLNKLRERNIKFNDSQAQENFSILVDYYAEQKIDNEDVFYIDILSQTYPKELIIDSYCILQKNLLEKQSPSQKTIGSGSLFFDIQQQPIFNNKAVGISDSQVYQILTKQNSFPTFVSDGCNAYIENYYFNLFGIESQQLIIKPHPNYMDICINKNPIMEDDGYELNLELVDLINLGYKSGSFILTVCRCSEELHKRFDCYIAINNQQKKVVLSERKTQVNFYLNKEGKTKINLNLSATKNLEAWNWGLASRIVISNFVFFKGEPLTIKYLGFLNEPDEVVG